MDTVKTPDINTVSNVIRSAVKRDNSFHLKSNVNAFKYVLKRIGETEDDKQNLQKVIEYILNHKKLTDSEKYHLLTSAKEKIQTILSSEKYVKLFPTYKDGGVQTEGVQGDDTGSNSPPQSSEPQNSQLPSTDKNLQSLSIDNSDQINLDVTPDTSKFDVGENDNDTPIPPAPDERTPTAIHTQTTQSSRDLSVDPITAPKKSDRPSYSSILAKTPTKHPLDVSNQEFSTPPQVVVKPTQFGHPSKVENYGETPKFEGRVTKLHNLLKDYITVDGRGQIIDKPNNLPVLGSDYNEIIRYLAKYRSSSPRSIQKRKIEWRVPRGLYEFLQQLYPKGEYAGTFFTRKNTSNWVDAALNFANRVKNKQNDGGVIKGRGIKPTTVLSNTKSRRRSKIKKLNWLQVKW